MRGGVRQDVELQVHGADEVQIHFHVEQTARNDAARVEGAAQKEVGAQAGRLGPGGSGEDEGEGGDEAGGAGGGAGGGGVAVEVVPGEDAYAAEGGPGDDGGEEDGDAISGRMMRVLVKVKVA